MAVERTAISQLRQIVGSSIDVFICCGSFEDRCLSVPSAIEPANVRTVIVGEHVNLHRHVAANTAKLMQRFEGKVLPLGLNSASPIQSADNIADALKTCRSDSKQKVLVDVTTFTHESLLILAELLGTVFSIKDDLHFVYTIAKEYANGLPYLEKWLSKGTQDIRSVLGFPGRVLPGRGIHLILLHGLEPERSKSLITNYEPAFLSLGRSDELAATADKDLLSANRRVHAEILSSQGTLSISRSSRSLRMTRKGRAESCRNARQRDDLSVIIAPMNTKLSALGAGLAARDNPEIQICYAQPATYNYEHYSTPSDTCYVFRMAGFLARDSPLEDETKRHEGISSRRFIGPRERRRRSRSSFARRKCWLTHGL